MKNLILLICSLYSAVSFSQTFTKYVDPVISTKYGEWFSVTPIDYDNNYTLDLFGGTNSSNPNRLFVNIGDSTFEEKLNATVVSQSGSTAQSFWADYDNDCDLDVFWPNANGSNFLYSNNGDGTFTGNTSGPIASDNISSAAATWIDYNNDGYVDLFVATRSQFGTNYLYKNNGGNSFTRIDTGAIALNSGVAWIAAWADIDNDGDADLFMGTDNSANNFLLINKGNGKFYNDTSSIITQEGFQTFGASWGDYNNDGYSDLFVARNPDYSDYLYKNNGDGTFTKVLNAGSITTDVLRTGGTAWADLDNDGDLDLYAAHTGNGFSTSNRNLIYKNNGNGTFSKITSVPVYQETYSTESASVADINNDGFLDILNANRLSSPISIFLNDGNNNNFIKFRLFGSSSNKMAIGARVEIHSSLGKQMRYIAGMSGNRTQPSYETHFGLGTDTIIDTLKIFWPAGGSCIVTNIPVNSFYNIGEGNCVLDSVISPEFNDSSSFLSAFFTNKSKGAASSYEWDFGDGNTSTQANPQHTYTQPGSYEVSLKVNDNFCRHRIIKDSISICPDTSRLGFINTTLNLQASFSDTSIAAAHAWYWDFGDGNNDSGKVANHVYAATGTYTVCLTVIDSCRSKQICRTIQICNSNLVANFTDSINGKTVSFTDATSSADSIYWTFGDGSASSQLNPIHVYSSPGTYFACVTAYDNCSSTTYCDSIEICPDVTVAGFAYSSNQTLVNFTDNSQFADSWHWDFGDGSFSNLQNPVKSYPAFGIYTVCLTSSSDCNTDSICQTINLCPYQAQASYTYSKGVIPTAVQFNNTSVDAVSYHWDFGDGSFSTQKNPLKVFANVQVYNVCLSVTDSCGNTNQYCEALDISTIGLEEQALDWVEVYPNPVTERLSINPGIITDGTLQIMIYDLSAKLLMDETLIINGSENLKIDLSHLASGTYLLKIKNKSGEKNIRLVKSSSF